MEDPRKYSDSEILRTFDAPTYTLAETSRLTGLSRYRIRRWLKGYKFSYEVDGGKDLRIRQQDPIVHRSGTKDAAYASFLDLVDMLFVKEFLLQGFTLQRIRRALNEAREFLKTPHVANNRFFTDGSGIYLEMPNKKHILALMTGGQWAIAPIIKQLAEKIDFHELSGIATRWYPLGKEGLIVVDPLISFGRPTIIGRSVATENVYDLFIGENKQIDQVSNWLEVPINEVNAAVNFEQSLIA